MSESRFGKQSSIVREQEYLMKKPLVRVKLCKKSSSCVKHIAADFYASGCPEVLHIATFKKTYIFVLMKFTRSKCNIQEVGYEKQGNRTRLEHY